MSRDQHSPTRQAHGFSVLEMVVAFAILTLAITLSARLLLESQRQMARVGRQATDGPIDAALERLRLDVMDARSLAGGTGLWTYDALELRFAAGRVRWWVDDHRLMRQENGTGGSQLMAVVLPRVLTFRWRAPTAPHHPLLEVELVDTATPRVVGIAQRTSSTSHLRRRAMRVALRAAPTGAW